MKRLLCLSAVVGLLTVAGGAYGQTGPVNQPPGGPSKSGQVPANNGMMTAERAAELLRQQGHQVNVQTASNGAKTVITTINKDNWRYVVEFEFSVDQKTMNVIAALTAPATKFSSEQLLALMKKSYEMNPPLHFSYRATDQRICLEDPLYNTVNMTDAFFNQVVTNFCQHIRDTHPLWDTSRWPA